MELHKPDDNWTSLGYSCRQINKDLDFDFPHIPRPGVTGRDNERTVPVRSATGTSPPGGTREPGAKWQETVLGFKVDYYYDDYGW